MDFIYSLFSGGNLNSVVLFLKPHILNHTLCCLCMCGLLRQISIGSLEGLHLPSQILATKFLMLILAPFIYWGFFFLA